MRKIFCYYFHFRTPYVGPFFFNIIIITGGREIRKGDDDDDQTLNLSVLEISLYWATPNPHVDISFWLC